ncbi:rRNA pseudouridine synthase [Corynebacterium sp. 320]|nr:MULTISPECIES: pseudouridine synthase [Corynebacterium]KAB1504491.1 rRNA pseudouridine synthase [Corynebacterium sp. 320]KAB1553450.1 rRNA pseudouridine synthase [Corynebacterium sp. 321]KAB1554442.1 rRNA pseudouridine synthase [Corynebacterium sp. 319]KAB3528627.1 rRNA pseudouridine synthase [Corynebacterium sp. 250]KAB3540938.1 rRNA pseudouridine synthase [Corynebacterium sp. 366]
MAAQRAQDEAAAVYVSNAKPAKRQHITDEERRAALASNENKDSQNLVRLQKVLASAGVASRRMSEKLIAMGRVEVNGEIVQQMGLRIDPHTDIVRVDGTRVQVNDQMVYFILNKPRGVHSTMSDELGRPCVGDFITERLEQGQGLFHVGRLDAETEGLLLLTNDGELANRLMHPSYQVTKTYMATVLGEVNRGIIRELKDGVELEDGIARADDVQIVDVWQGKSLLRVELHEGRKHIVRRMLKELGYPVQALVRTKIHTVQLGDQKPGSVRAMNASELASLYKVVGL